jgi:hypothetical protein
MKDVIIASLIGVTVIALVLVAAGCGGVSAKTQPTVGVYSGEPIIYPYSISELKKICRQVLRQQDYMIVSEGAKKIRAVRHRKLWKHLQSSDMALTFTELRPNTTRIDILSQTASGKFAFNLQDKYIKDFLTALRKRIIPEPETPRKKTKK